MEGKGWPVIGIVTEADARHVMNMSGQLYTRLLKMVLSANLGCFAFADREHALSDASAHLT